MHGGRCYTAKLKSKKKVIDFNGFGFFVSRKDNMDNSGSSV